MRCFRLACKREGVLVPTMIVPIKNWPVPLRLSLKNPLCQLHASAFTMNNYTDYNGSWYDMVQDHLRSIRKPAANPYPNDPTFKWEEFIINPNWEAVPREQCYLEMWDVRTLEATKATINLEPGSRLKLSK